MPDFGLAIPKIQGAGRPAAMNNLLAAFINAIVDLADEIALVLDDYHAIRAEDVHEMLRFLLDNAPPNLQIAVASRIDLPLDTSDPATLTNNQRGLVRMIAGSVGPKAGVMADHQIPLTVRKNEDIK